jgi:hypothetical protein
MKYKVTTTNFSKYGLGETLFCFTKQKSNFDLFNVLKNTNGVKLLPSSEGVYLSRFFVR